MDFPLVKFYYKQFGDSRKILDLGCGRGDFGRFKPNSSTTIIGLDKDVSLLRASRRYYAGLCIYDLNQGTLPFIEKVFDSILAKDVLEHLTSPRRIVEEMYRILCPGGIALAQVPMAKAKVVWNDYTHIRGFTKESLRSLFEDCGFVTITIYKMGGIPLAGRLDMARFIPILLKIPFFDYFFGSSHLIKVKKPSQR